MHLQTQGFRFIDRNGDFNWRHTNQLQAGDIDCTDMDDEEFEAQVRRYPQHVLVG